MLRYSEQEVVPNMKKPAFRMRMAAANMPAKTRDTHRVRCWHCGEEFDLLEAAWCGCGRHVDRPSKSCPHCLQCVCDHPDYLNEALWGEAPRYLRKRGIPRLFYLYL